MNISKEILEELYCNQDIPVKNICIKLKLSEQGMYKYLRKYNISLKHPISLNKHITKEDIKRTYNETWNIRKAAKSLNVSESWLSRHMKKENIKIKTHTERKLKRINITKEQIKNLYNKGYSSNDMAKKFNVGDYKILSLMKFYNIKRRTRKETSKFKIFQEKNTRKRNKYRKFNNRDIKKETLVDLYCDKKIIKKEISKELNISSGHLNKLMKKYNIKNIIRTGLDSPFFKGDKFERDGRKRIWMPKHHRACGGYVFNQIVVMENMLGRKIKKGEITHHKNGIASDDRPENLQLIKSRSEHSRLHALFGGKNVKGDEIIK